MHTHSHTFEVSACMGHNYYATFTIMHCLIYTLLSTYILTLLGNLVLRQKHSHWWWYNICITVSLIQIGGLSLSCMHLAQLKTGVATCTFSNELQN